MSDELKNPRIPKEIKKREYLRQWRIKNRDKWNSYRRDWYANKKVEEKQKCIM